MTGKNINCSNKTVKHSIKTLSGSILPTQLIQPGYATASIQRIHKNPANSFIEQMTSI